MQLLNETWLASQMLRAQVFYEDLLQATVVVKGSYNTLPSGLAEPAADPGQVYLEDEETAFGVLDAEILPVKAWCDVAVLGHARSPARDRPVTQSTVTLRIGDFSRVVQVTGNRVWLETSAGPRASEPEPFHELPLSYRYAFGGQARQQAEVELAGAYLPNPEGRGYVELEQDVVGTALPNIEELDEPVRTWQDRPTPAGLAPLSRLSLLRGQRGYHVDVERQTARIDPAAFGFAHPRMCLPSFPRFAECELTGTSFEGSWKFFLPTFDYSLQVELGAARYELPLTPDTLYLHPDEHRVVVVARCSFIYQFLPERLRAARIIAGSGQPKTAEPTTIHRERTSATPAIPLVLPTPRGMSLSMEPFVAAHPMRELIENLPLCPSG